MPHGADLEEETAATRRGWKTSHDCLPYLYYVKKKKKKKLHYSAGRGRQQTLPSRGRGTNPQGRDQKTCSSLKGEAGMCPKHETTNGEKARVLLRKSHL